MMNIKLKSLLKQMLCSPRHFPVEMTLGVMFFIIAVLHEEYGNSIDKIAVFGKILNHDILWLFTPLMVLTFWSHRCNRLAYYASFFLFLPLMALDLKTFIWTKDYSFLFGFSYTYGFKFTYILAAILLVIGNRKMENRPFAAHAIHVVTQLFLGLLVSGILNLTISVILKSFFYIFDIDIPKHLFWHFSSFVWYVLAPQICCTLIRQNEDEVAEPFKALRLILNFILSPAVIIYTVILYVYFIKVVFEWNLPKGGVAWMVIGFIAAVLIGRVAQAILSQRYYDWFYNRFTLIAIPPLIMFWVGAIYRIRLYDFTESRFYLIVAGVLMTLFVLMLFRKRTRRFQLMALIFGSAIIVFTYIPGISAKSIGLCCQKQRLVELITELKIADNKTGKLNDNLNMVRIINDSLMCERYKNVTSVICYIRNVIGKEEFISQYGEWKYSEVSFEYSKGLDEIVEGVGCHREKPVDLGEYTVMLPEDTYKCSYENRTVKISNGNEDVILEYPIQKIFRQDTMFQYNPEKLFTYRNDSLMLVLESIYMNDTVITDLNESSILLFRKKKK